MLENTLQSLWELRRSNQSILKKINPEYPLEGLMLKLKLQYFGHLMQRACSLEETLMLGKIESVVPSNHLILCHLLLVLPSIFPSIKVFSNKSALCTRWPKYWSFSFSISPSNGYSGLISFRLDWFDLAVQGTQKSLPQYHN